VVVKDVVAISAGETDCMFLQYKENMFDVSVIIFSNKCGCSLSRRKRRKVVYVGTNEAGFRDRLNAFVADEYHRYAAEYKYIVQCAKSRRSSSEDTIVPWNELCALFEQMIGYPIEPSSNNAQHPYEYIRTLLIDEDELCLLIAALHKLSRPAVKTEEPTSSLSPPLPPQRQQPTVIDTVNKRGVISTSSYTETNPSVYKKCRERIAELDRVKDDCS
jgi:hypothetical protein